MARQPNNAQGFTLIETLVVLTIIALIVGGIFVGQNLIRQSELRSVLADINTFTSATLAFKEKYGYLPGDMPNATSIWGPDPNGCPNGSPGTTTKATTTCNGNGDGQIGAWPAISSANLPELFRAWQQLSDAGLIPGAYTGVTGAGSSYNSVIGSNVPSSRIQGGGYTMLYLGYYAEDSDVFGADYGNTLLFGSVWQSTYATYGPLITTEDAYSVDVKADDGLPASGRIMSWKNATQVGCVILSGSSYVYATASAAQNCMLIFQMGF